MNDPLTLSTDQQSIIERALITIDKMREFVLTCDKAKLFQMSARYRKMAMELEETIQLQVQELRFDSFPANWSTDERLKLLGTTREAMRPTTSNASETPVPQQELFPASRSTDQRKNRRTR